MEMDVDYDWRFNTPGDQLTVHMENAREGNKIFDATLVLQRKEITSRCAGGCFGSVPVDDTENHRGDSLAGAETVAQGRRRADHPDKIQPVLEEANEISILVFLRVTWPEPSTPVSGWSGQARRAASTGAARNRSVATERATVRTIVLARPGLRTGAHIQVLDPRFYSEIAFGGSIGAGEAYMHGLLELR